MVLSLQSNFQCNWQLSWKHNVKFLASVLVRLRTYYCKLRGNTNETAINKEGSGCIWEANLCSLNKKPLKYKLEEAYSKEVPASSQTTNFISASMPNWTCTLPHLEGIILQVLSTIKEDGTPSSLFASSQFFMVTILSLLAPLKSVQYGFLVLIGAYLLSIWCNRRRSGRTNLNQHGDSMLDQSQVFLWHKRVVLIGKVRTHYIYIYIYIALIKVSGAFGLSRLCSNRNSTQS